MAQENFHEKGKKLLEECKYAEAITALKWALKLALMKKQESAWTCFYLSKAYLGLVDIAQKNGEKPEKWDGDWDESVKYANRTAMGLPEYLSNIWVLLQMARIYVHKSDGGSKAKALEYVSKALEVDKGDNSWVYSQLAFIYFKLGDKENAETYTRKAIAIKKDNIEAALVIGMLFFDNGAEKKDTKILERAIDIFNKVLETNSNNAEAWYWKGRAHFALGRYAEAQQCYTKAGLRIVQKKVRKG